MYIEEEKYRKYERQVEAKDRDGQRLIWLEREVMHNKDNIWRDKWLIISHTFKKTAIINRHG